jgi:calcium/proton exchanger cax
MGNQNHALFLDMDANFFLGMCFFFGGWGRDEQYFNEIMAQTAPSLLSLAIAGLIIPTAYFEWATQVNSTNTASTSATTVEGNNVKLSRGTAVLLLVVYGCYLYFQLPYLNLQCTVSKGPEKTQSSQSPYRRRDFGNGSCGRQLVCYCWREPRQRGPDEA